MRRRRDLQLLAACDLAYDTPGTSFCPPGVQNGRFCAKLAVSASHSIGRGHVMKMALSVGLFDADWILLAGLINRAIQPDGLDDEVLGFARTLASGRA
ncbi:MAG: hypothetical protein ACFB11_08550 [Paracoccaceae bacterium]